MISFRLVNWWLGRGWLSWMVGECEFGLDGRKRGCWLFEMRRLGGLGWYFVGCVLGRRIMFCSNGY